MPSPNLPFEKPSQVLSVIGPDANDTVSAMDDHAITAPQIPDPATTQAQMNSPTVENRRATDFDLLNVGVWNPGTEERQRAETNRQAISLIYHRQMMEAHRQQCRQDAADGEDDGKRRLFLGRPMPR